MKRLLCILCVAALFMSGCAGKKITIDHPYALYDAAKKSSGQMFSHNLCVTEKMDFGTDQVDSALAEGAGVFNVTKKEVTYSQNLFEKFL